MGSTEGYRWLGAVLCGVLAWGVVEPAALGAGTGSGQPLYGCDQAMGHSTGHGLVKTTDPPAGSRLEPGQEIRVELSWRTGDWTGGELHKVLDCVTLDGKLSSVLSGGEKPTANDGRFSYRYRVPADAAPGTAVCDRGFLSGPRKNDDFAQAESDILCFSVAPLQSRRAGDVGPPAVPPGPPPEVAGERLTGAASSPIGTSQPAPSAAVPVPGAATQLPRTGGAPPPGPGLACLALAALVRCCLRRPGQALCNIGTNR